MIQLPSGVHFLRECRPNSRPPQPQLRAWGYRLVPGGQTHHQCTPRLATGHGEVRGMAKRGASLQEFRLPVQRPKEMRKNTANAPGENICAWTQRNRERGCSQHLWDTAEAWAAAVNHTAHRKESSSYPELYGCTRAFPGKSGVATGFCGLWLPVKQSVK